ALLMPFAAAALPFLVNLAASGSIESTSSQAKSILAEPHPDVRHKYLTDSPRVWLSIVTAYLSWLQLDGDGNLVRRYWIPSAAALAWGRLPRYVGAPLAAFIVVAPLAGWAPTATDVYDRVILFYGHNCENILHQQVKVGRWIDHNLPRNAVVGMNDAGAIAYYWNRPTFDLLGL